MKDRSIIDMAERLLQRKPTPAEIDILNDAPTIADVNLICNDILTRAKRLSESDFAEDYERARRMMLILPKDDINLIIDVIEGRRVEAFVKGFLPGGYEIRPVGRATEQTHPPDTYRSQGSLKMAFLQDMLEAENVGMIEVEAAFEQARAEYRKTVEEDRRGRWMNKKKRLELATKMAGRELTQDEMDRIDKLSDMCKNLERLKQVVAALEGRA